MRVVTNLRKWQCGAERIESRFLLSLPSFRCLPNGIPLLSNSEGHRKVNETRAPLHFSRAPCSSAINNCPPLIAPPPPPPPSLPSSLWMVSSTNIRPKKGKIAPDLRLPLILHPSLADRQTQVAVKEQHRISIRDFALKRTHGPRVKRWPRVRFNARWQDGINRGEEARLKGFPLLFHPRFLANGVVLVIRTRSSTAFGRGKYDF